MDLELVSYKRGANIVGAVEQGTEKIIWFQERRDIRRMDKI